MLNFPQSATYVAGRGNTSHLYAPKQIDLEMRMLPGLQRQIPADRLKGLLLTPATLAGVSVEYPN